MSKKHDGKTTTRGCPYQKSELQYKPIDKRVAEKMELLGYTDVKTQKLEDDTVLISGIGKDKVQKSDIEQLVAVNSVLFSDFWVELFGQKLMLCVRLKLNTLLKKKYDALIDVINGSDSESENDEDD